HRVRPDAPPLRGVLPTREGFGPHLPSAAESSLRHHLAGATPIPARAEGTSRRPEIRVERPNSAQAVVQLHRRPEALRNLPAPIPVLPRIRFHAVAFGSHLLRFAGASDD